MIQNYTNWMVLNADSVLSSSSCFPKPQPNGGETCNMSWLFGKSLHNMSIGPLYGLLWNGPFIEGAPAQHTAALELFSALIPDNTTCIGTDCEWDPPQSA